MSKNHPDGSLVTKLHPRGTAATKLHPDGHVATKLHPRGTMVTRVHPAFVQKAGAAGDAFLDACLDVDELFGLWTCSEVDIDDALATGQVIMTDLSENDRPDIKAVLEATGNWQLETGSGPGGDSPSLTKYVTNDATDMGTTNFGAIDSAISPISDKLDPSSGFVIYFMPSHWGNDHEVVAYTGIDTAGAGSAETLMLGSYGDSEAAAFMHASQATAGTSPSVQKGSGGTEAGTGFGLCGKWIFWAWRNDKRGSDEFNHYSYIQEIGSAWGDDQTKWLLGPQGSFASLMGGLRFGYGSSGAIPAGCRWAAFAIFDDDITEATFEGIYDAAGFDS